MTSPSLYVIGERINPGFESSRRLFDTRDLDAIQALALRQEQAGANCLNVNLGTAATTDPAFLVEVVRAIQQAVGIPLSFDSPDLASQRLFLETYDDSLAGGAPPVINSIAESRLELMTLLELRPCRVILMTSERLEGDEIVANRTADDVLGVTRRLAHRLGERFGLAPGELFADVSINMLASDRDGSTRRALAAVGLIRGQADLARIRIMGGISNIGMSLPAKSVDGHPLKNRIERAFLTRAVPLGLDTVLGTPWHCRAPLEEGDATLQTFDRFLRQDGLAALREVRHFYKETPSGQLHA